MKRLKAERTILRAVGSPNDISPETCRKREYAPGSVFEETDSIAEKLMGNGGAVETDEPISTEPELEALRVYRDEHLKRVEAARLERIRKSQE